MRVNFKLKWTRRRAIQCQCSGHVTLLIMPVCASVCHCQWRVDTIIGTGICHWHLPLAGAQSRRATFEFEAQAVANHWKLELAATGTARGPAPSRRKGHGHNSESDGTATVCQCHCQCQWLKFRLWLSLTLASRRRDSESNSDLKFIPPRLACQYYLPDSEYYNCTTSS